MTRLRSTADRPLGALAVLVFLFAQFAMALPAFAGGGPAETVVLVNEASEDGKRVAEHYIKARRFPRAQVCRVTCGTGLDQPMTEFVKDVVEPLRSFLRVHDMEGRVRFVVLTQGMPIRATTAAGPVSTAAALSLLMTPLCGADGAALPRFANPYHEGAAESAEFAPGAPIFCVTALLSTTVDEATGLIDRSVASDGTAPPEALFVFQDANGNANLRNREYDGARTRLEALRMKTEHVAAGAAVVTNRKRVMGYMAGGVYSALTPQGVATNEYLPGAICDHLQSYGAVPQNFGADAKGFSQFPITHMVRAGITGVHGAVAEPYASTFPSVDIFSRYVAGYTLGESFQGSLPALYWMNLTLGDPLCAPYATRPKVTATLSVAKPAETTVHLRATAEGAVRLAAYVNGRLLGTGATGPTLDVDVPTALLADALGEVLVEAVGPGAHEPRGWTLIQSDVKPPKFAAGSDLGAAPRVVATALTVDAPKSVVAGQAFELRVNPTAPAGWKGRVEVRTATPPVRYLAKDVDLAGAATPLTLRFTSVGDIDLRVTLPDDQCEANVKIHVTAGKAHHATTPLADVPLLQPCDIPVLVLDEFGNPADFDGEVTMTIAGTTGSDGSQSAPSVTVKSGRGVFRDITFRTPGRQTLAFATKEQGTISDPSEGVACAHVAIRAWLGSGVSQTLTGAKFFDADLATADRHGSVAGGALFRRVRDRDDVIELTGSAKDGDVAAAVTMIDALAACEVSLLAAAPARLKVLLDNKPVFDGVPKQTDPGGKRESVAKFKLPAGPHRLVVIAERKAKHAFSVELVDEKGAPAPVAVLPNEVGTPPKRFVVSGRVTEPKGGAAANVKVVVTDRNAKAWRTTSGQDGTWFVEGLPAGAFVAKVDSDRGAGAAATATEHPGVIEKAHVTDMDLIGEPAPAKPRK